MSEVFTAGTKHNLKPNHVAGEYHNGPAKNIGEVHKNSRSGEPFSSGTEKRMKSEHNRAAYPVGAKMDVSKPVTKEYSQVNSDGTNQRRKSEIARADVNVEAKKELLFSDTQIEQNIDGDE